MQFIDEGKLSLDTKIADYLPIYAKYSKKYITIRHCLAHLTGIENKKGLAAILEGGKFETLDELIEDLESTISSESEEYLNRPYGTL